MGSLVFMLKGGRAGRPIRPRLEVKMGVARRTIEERIREVFSRREKEKGPGGPLKISLYTPGGSRVSSLIEEIALFGGFASLRQDLINRGQR